jgi:TolB-like protein/Flp pilus assembly protein TadD
LSLFNELKRRNVFRVGLAYAVISWLVLQVIDVVVPILELQPWVGKLVFLMLAAGLPVALVLAWAFELTPEGIKRDNEVDRKRSMADRTGRKLDFLIIGVMAAALIYFALNHDWGQNQGGRRIGTASGQSIAVLPFTNRSALEADVFFVDGVHDDLLTLLSKLGDLKVISRTSVEKFRETRLSMPELARQLGVATVLEGAVQRAGGQVRITVQLIDAGTDEHLWAESYDRELTAENIFAIQSDIAQVIAQSLQAVLTPEEQSRVAAVPTSNFAAYEEFLRGRQKMVFREIPDIRQAVEHFHRSIQLDPGFAMAYVGLADAYHMLLYYGDMSIAETIPPMEAAVTSALELDPDLGEAQTALATLFRYQDRTNEAIAAYERAIELAPGYATSYHWLAEHWRTDNNRPDLALPLIRKARELDPLSPVINLTVAETLRDLGLHDEALAQIDHTIEISPAYASAYIAKSDILAWSFGNLKQALRLFDYSVELDPQSLNACGGKALVLSALGDDTGAKEQIEHCLVLGPDYIWAHYNAMIVYLASGDTERSLQHARWVHSVGPGLWVPLRILRDADIAAGQAAKARARYISVNMDFNGQSTLEVTPNNHGAATAYAYLLLLAGEHDRMRQFLLPVLDFLTELPRLGFFGAGIEDVRALAMLGETDRALEKLEEAVAAGWRLNWRMDLGLGSLDSIRDDPRFIAQKEIIEADMAAQLDSYRSSRVSDEKATSQISRVPPRSK